MHKDRYLNILLYTISTVLFAGMLYVSGADLEYKVAQSLVFLGLLIFNVLVAHRLIDIHVAACIVYLISVTAIAVICNAPIGALTAMGVSDGLMLVGLLLHSIISFQR